MLHLKVCRWTKGSTRAFTRNSVIVSDCISNDDVNASVCIGIVVMLIDVSWRQSNSSTTATTGMVVVVIVGVV